MTQADLQHIFKPQLEEGTDKLYFMLVDGTNTVTRCSLDEMEGLLPMLDSFQYAGSFAGIPRFVK